ncbi:alpha-E domain-containing protein [Rhodospirillaceae bacterium KN72]|uniref:Alpha-E domain-containing protein n=1 Tax=Pacificispira spongiicola TaxID=2729598 RepID=A0A7Y0DYJ4_9PROT|nr:alpha-E domain-containing protein [Pacificispira spongiicola]NMM43984.1 alpha-E domain-containing protein [Pacificispira spongiicola]
MTQQSLLARYAEDIFWMARYMERADNLARLLEVNEVFARDRRGAHNWDAIIDLNADREAFTKRYGTAKPTSTAYFYMLDRENPSSIISAVRAARENARALRPLISTEMWTHLNIFYNELLEIPADATRVPNMARFCERIRNACHAHSGITEGTFYRDQGWYFYQLGMMIERADQTTRIVDVKYHTLLPSAAEVGSLLDLSQWNALLRSAAGYHAYRRVHPSGIEPSAVAEFLILNRRFPRSVRFCIGEVSAILSQLIFKFQLSRGGSVAAVVDRVHRRIEETDIEKIISDGMHEFLDTVQIDLSEITSAMNLAYFGHDTIDEESVA